MLIQRIALVLIFCAALSGCGQRGQQGPAPLSPESPAESSDSDSSPGAASSRHSSEPALSQPDPDAAPILEVQPQTAAAILSPIDNSRIEQELLRLINGSRQQHGMESLGMEEAMQFAARIRAQEALMSLSHTRPDGAPYHTAFDEAGFPYAGKWHGENLATIQVEGDATDEAAIAAAIYAEWESNSGHQQNILNPSFYQTGIGLYIERGDGFSEIGAAQLFSGF